MSEKYKGKAFYDEQMDKLRKQYKDWKRQKKEENAPFFMIYSDFKDHHLKTLSGGALKLYLYLGFHVNNFTGECWHSIETIADFFGNDPRTVRKWFEELEQQGAVKRYQTGYKRIANTFLLPYGEEKGEEKENE